MRVISSLHAIPPPTPTLRNAKDSSIADGEFRVQTCYNNRHETAEPRRGGRTPTHHSPLTHDAAHARTNKQTSTGRSVRAPHEPRSRAARQLLYNIDKINEYRCLCLCPRYGPFFFPPVAVLSLSLSPSFAGTFSLSQFNLAFSQTRPNPANKQTHVFDTGTCHRRCAARGLSENIAKKWRRSRPRPAFALAHTTCGPLIQILILYYYARDPVTLRYGLVVSLPYISRNAKNLFRKKANVMTDLRPPSCRLVLVRPE
jgi:hypothetical protein